MSVIYATAATRELAEAADRRFAQAHPLETLAWAGRTFGSRLVVASSMADEVVAHLASRNWRPCFIAHAALDRARFDGWTAQCVQDGFQDCLRLWEHRFRRAQAEGDLGPHHDSRTLSLVFQSTIYGLQVSALAGVARPDLEAAVRITLSILG